MEKSKKLGEGDEVIFMLPNQTIMEKVKVESIDKKNGIAILANKVKISRVITDGTFPRRDGKDGFAIPITEQTEKGFQAYRAYHSIYRNLDFIMNKVKDLDKSKEIDLILDLDKKISKIITKYFPR